MRGSDGGALGHDRYRLRPVREVRARDEQVKRGELASAVGDARATGEQIAAAAARVTAAREAVASAERMRTTLPATATSLARLAAERYAARRRRDLADALLEHAHAAADHDRQLGAIDDARARLTIARAEREVIERHFARWRETQRKAAERNET